MKAKNKLSLLKFPKVLYEVNFYVDRNFDSSVMCITCYSQNDVRVAVEEALKQHPDYDFSVSLVGGCCSW